MNSLSYSAIERDIMIFENASDRIDTSINLNTLIYNQSLRDAETRVFRINKMGLAHIINLKKNKLIN